jgi:hypothetical protein
MPGFGGEMIGESKTDGKKEINVHEKTPMIPRPCPRHHRWTDDFGDCLECLSRPTLGLEDWDRIEVKNQEGRKK